MLSVLIPVFNYQVVSLVRTMVEQTKNTGIIFEIIVLDDASTDAEVISSHKFLEELPHCRYYQSEKNQGRTATRNFLAEKAKYGWLLFLDADVMPKNKDFIAKFLLHTDADLVFGGIGYANEKPEKNRMLRWKYGRAREGKSVEERLKYPYLSVISGCLLIKKEIFLKVNDTLENQYGLDVLFCQNLEKRQAVVKHIDNPVIHLGLEDNRSFIEKTKKGLDSLFYFEKRNLIPDNYRPIQQSRNTLRKYGLTAVFLRVMKLFVYQIERNLLSKNPSLFLFDLYKLYYLIKLK